MNMVSLFSMPTGVATSILGGQPEQQQGQGQDSRRSTYSNNDIGIDIVTSNFLLMTFIKPLSLRGRPHFIKESHPYHLNFHKSHHHSS